MEPLIEKDSKENEFFEMDKHPLEYMEHYRNENGDTVITYLRPAAEPYGESHSTSTRQKNKFQCYDCNKKFGNWFSLCRHNHVGHNRCNKAWLWKLALRNHTRQKRIKCKDCTLAYDDRYDFIQHKCTRSKPLKCNECNEEFSSRACLLNHKMVEQILFKCDKCFQTFRCNILLTEHKLTHNPDFWI